MTAVLRMCMIVNPAGSIIANMRDYDQDDRRGQEPGFVSDEKLLGY